MRYTKRDGNYIGKDRKLWELENDIEDGLLVKLPCKVGDKYYSIIGFHELTPTIIEETVKEVLYSIRGETTMQPLEQLNVNWFIDRELAKKKLEELNNERT